MKDCFGNEVNVGDKVICIINANDNPKLKCGTITKVYKNDEECSVDSYSHIYSHRICKLDFFK